MEALFCFLYTDVIQEIRNVMEQEPSLDRGAREAVLGG